MKRFSLVLILVAGLAVTGARCSFTTTVKGPAKNANLANTNVAANTNAAPSITYPGQTGKNALELLQSKHGVDVSAQGFVNTIDGRKPGDHQFWAFYVNGQQADVGAKDYQAKSNDTIEWKLESF